MRKITMEILQAHNACKRQVKLFQAVFPDGAESTEQALQLALDAGLDIHWAAENLLSASALAEYEKTRASAWAEYNKTCAPALAEYQKTYTPAYQKTCASAWAEYKKTYAPAEAECQKTCAYAFLNAWRGT